MIYKFSEKININILYYYINNILLLGSIIYISLFLIYKQ